MDLVMLMCGRPKGLAQCGDPQTSHQPALKNQGRGEKNLRIFKESYDAKNDSKNKLNAHNHISNNTQNTFHINICIYCMFHLKCLFFLTNTFTVPPIEKFMKAFNSFFEKN